MAEKTFRPMLTYANDAHRAGITEQADYAALQNYGYMGLDGDLQVSDIHARKNFLKTKRYWITWEVRNWA